MERNRFGSHLWKPVLDKYALATGLTVELYGVGGNVILGSEYPTPLLALFRECGSEPGLFAECASRCLNQKESRTAVIVTDPHGLAVVGTSLALDGEIVGAAVAGYALTEFSHVTAVQHWSRSADVPFDRLWNIARRLPPAPERRLMLHGELLQVLGDTLLSENHRTRLLEDTAAQLKTAAAAKDEFLAVLSHELRTPLAAISGWTGVLRMSGSTEHTSRAVEAIERNVRLQTRMIEDLLDVNRIAEGKVGLDLGIHTLHSLLRAALETIALDVDKKEISIEFVDTNEPLFVEGDYGRLQQVFRNILFNAVKFTPHLGSIKVTLSRDTHGARVVVADTGIGITPEFLPFVFDIFKQQERGTRREYGGLGVGLALVRKLVELHKGTVRVESAGTGHGTQVIVELPLTPEIPALIPAVSAPQISADALVGVSVLVIEDSEDSRESLRTLLQLLGATVAVARDGREALDMIEGASPDLVLCDLRMPRMDGFEFMHELNQRPSAHPPVVAMSGLVSDADRNRTRRAGFESHINKPFDQATIVAAFGAVISRRPMEFPVPGISHGPH